ncbi:hypothetical protein PAP_02885 [Palaeococcus pacificus DY20341]|uniref:THUMP domain-containing protein n=1 Tax=Palaeococcus pacificus DY20341 TaxID=1343739 RepID=A0A075LSQ4_9EURY|nr:hypothetical protein [Palaeococcus pacificus]AIF68997.1 hypothetical protein PAP_02885 [Palaeococcus pacificus DY20341]
MERMLEFEFQLPLSLSREVIHRISGLCLGIRETFSDSKAEVSVLRGKSYYENLPFILVKLARMIKLPTEVVLIEGFGNKIEISNAFLKVARICGKEVPIVLMELYKNNFPLPSKVSIYTDKKVISSREDIKLLINEALPMIGEFDSVLVEEVSFNDNLEITANVSVKRLSKYLPLDSRTVKIVASIQEGELFEIKIQNIKTLKSGKTFISLH